MFSWELVWQYFVHGVYVLVDVVVTVFRVFGVVVVHVSVPLVQLVLGCLGGKVLFLVVD